MLSGWKPNKSVSLTDLRLFDAQTQGSIREVQALFFVTCQSLSTKNSNVSQRVIDVLEAYLVLHSPLLRVKPQRTSCKRLETCVMESGSTLAYFLAWSMHLATTTCAEVHIEEEEPANKSIRV